MNCPACGYYNPAGLPRCFQCGLTLPVGAVDALCPAHPGVKALGACSRCGTFGCASCLAQRGDDWLCPGCQQRLVLLPWDERESLGVWRAWWRTSVMMISSPGQTLATAQPDAPLGSSVLLSFISALVGYVPTFGLYLLFLGPMLLLLGKRPGELELASGALIYGLMVGYMVAAVAMQVASTLFFAGLDHLMLLLLGAQPRPFTVTARAAALSMGPYLVGLFPVCSFYVFPLWSLVLRIFALKALHQVSGNRAAAAVLVPLFVLCGGFAFLYFAIVGLAAVAGR